MLAESLHLVASAIVIGSFSFWIFRFIRTRKNNNHWMSYMQDIENDSRRIWYEVREGISDGPDVVVRHDELRRRALVAAQYTQHQDQMSFKTYRRKFIDGEQ